MKRWAIGWIFVSLICCDPIQNFSLKNERSTPIHVQIWQDEYYKTEVWQGTLAPGEIRNDIQPLSSGQIHMKWQSLESPDFMLDAYISSPGDQNPRHHKIVFLPNGGFNYLAQKYNWFY